MSKLAIKAENISKQYRLGEVGTGTLSHDLNRMWHKLQGKEDPYLKIGEANNRATKGESDYVWSLQNINFEIEQGDAVGIIGRNGAGKSTLLKILSKVTKPTTGSIKVNGRIASLLEVGTGFNPEMTGRENIYLNGAILGMRRAEITRKLDEIIDFSGVERYIDTPVKRYSSGMYVRLAFAVAAHLESEILIVDEVLAVGDAEFQKKCLGKMGDVSKGEGKTVLFVSHNMTAIANLCNNLIVLKNGINEFEGNVNKGIEKYISINLKERNFSIHEFFPEDDFFKLLKFEITNNELGTSNFNTKDLIRIGFSYIIKKKVNGLRIGFDLIDDKSGITLFRTFHDDNVQIDLMNTGNYNSVAELPGNFLKPGNYSINLAIGIHNIKWISYQKISIQFTLINIDGINKQYADNRPGVLMPKIFWSNIKLN
jgi:lipopolysaccharide transport system ATP-binding protein